MANVMVYGTLLSGERNNNVIVELGGKLINQNYRLEGATLYADPESAPFPFLVVTGKLIHHVDGELWEVPESAMWALDAFEGVPALYERMQINGVYVYGLGSPYPGTVDIGPSWREYRRAKEKLVEAR